MAERFVLALDQGTTSSRAILVDHAGRPRATAQREFPQQYPSPGHVTHDPEAIWSSQLDVAREVLSASGVEAAQIAGIGVANQRETTIVWERATGRPVADAIVWQSRVTAPYCDELRAAGHEPAIRAITGLPIDAYFSGPKLRYILREDEGRADGERTGEHDRGRTGAHDRARTGGLAGRAARGELAFGTVDSFLIWRLTGGRRHVTDVSNASRTLLFDLHRLAWADELLDLMDIPSAVLPEVVPSSGVVGETDPSLFGRAIPIAGIAGDQQAATFGQACVREGQAKVTYGTGAFLLANTGERPTPSANGLLTTVLWQLADGDIAYALEGSVFIAGAAVQWLRDGLKAFERSSDVEALAASVQDTGGVYVVPAFVGLGAPYWDPWARGAILGLTRGSGLAEIARATIESIAYQVGDVLDAMAADTGRRIASLRVDGGAAANDPLLRFQADIVGMPVERPEATETTALGAAYLAGLAVGFWHDVTEIEANWTLDRRFEPSMDPAERDRRIRGWHRAVERSRGWAAPGDVD